MWKQPEPGGKSFGPADTKALEAYLGRILSAGVWTRAEAVRKLVARGASRRDAEDLVKRFSERGCFDDRSYALLFVDTHSEWGMIRLRDELRRRGVPQDCIDEAVLGVDEESRAEALALGWRRLGMEAGGILSRLLRRGFSPRVSRKVSERACEPED